MFKIHPIAERPCKILRGLCNSYFRAVCPEKALTMRTKVLVIAEVEN